MLLIDHAAIQPMIGAREKWLREAEAAENDRVQKQNRKVPF